MQRNLRCSSVTSQKVGSRLLLRPPCIAKAISSQPNAPTLQERVYKAKDTHRYSKTSESWHGCVGNWFVDAHDPASAHVVRGLRSFKWRDASRTVLDQTNVYDKPRPGTLPRPSDGLYQKDFVYDGPQFSHERLEAPIIPFPSSSAAASSSSGALLVLDPASLINVGSFNLPRIALEPPPSAPTAAGTATAAPQGAPPPALTPPVAAPAAGGDGVAQQTAPPAAASPAAPGGTDATAAAAAADADAAKAAGGVGARVAVSSGSSMQWGGLPVVGASPVWGMEVFLLDGPYRWSFAVLYDTSDGALRRLTLIQETETIVDPASRDALSAAVSSGAAVAGDFAARAVLDHPRDTLEAGDAATWVDPERWQGLRVARIGMREGSGVQEEQGQQVLVLQEGLQEPVVWEPNSSTSALLLPLPDSMYARLPATLRAVAEPEPGGDSKDAFVTFEFGGLLRTNSSGSGASASGGGGGLQRLVLRYDGMTGEFVDVVHEVFAPLRS